MYYYYYYSCLLMCRINNRMANYINSITHNNKSTKEINRTQLKQK